MSFKVHEQHGIWKVIQESGELRVQGGISITHEQYVELKDTPHKSADSFHRVRGELVLRKDRSRK